MENAVIKKTGRKSWHEKLEGLHEGYPKIVDIPQRWARTMGPGKMVILTPLIVNDFIKTIPEGKLATVNLIRKKFAREYQVEATCPLTTGIFVWICSGAAEEDRLAGKPKIAPYWRVLKEGGLLNPKFPGGVREQARRLTEEGFKVKPSDKDTAWKVLDYEKHLMKT